MRKIVKRSKGEKSKHYEAFGRRREKPIAKASSLFEFDVRDGRGGIVHTIGV